MGFVLLLCMVPTVLLSELEDYRSKKYTYTESISKQFKNNILDYWNFIKVRESARFSTDSCTYAKTTEMIENEFQENQDDEVASFANTYDISIHNIEQLQHPAIDLQAKWKLKNIFVENLESPNYLLLVVNINYKKPLNF
ncbi:unnamed protein product [Rhizophagus irregularis]|uniref:Uncharacterized protein n=1 Tax=Rhizophagus irregularis TaxID=588596 RepID=A0A915ZSE4_9GLOM|nr:unnamed protein product [Rhizophagus irregularis]CAB5196126.1 unnamed protein product [Rhizophagus irregularis]CAB5385275.1 unnamed protein product [Rhizophagus irregularis]